MNRLPLLVFPGGSNTGVPSRFIRQGYVNTARMDRIMRDWLSLDDEANNPSDSCLFTDIGGGVYLVKVGSVQVAFTAQSLIDVFNGGRDVLMLIWDLTKALKAAGYHPANVSAAQIKVVADKMRSDY